jgi:integrase
MAKVKFTAGRVEAFSCEDGKGQSFLWDATAPGLGLRATANGAKAYMFQAKLKGQAIRVTIGDPKTWNITAAQAEARRLKVIIDNGQDPRQVKADGLASEQAAREIKATEAEAARTEAQRLELTLGEVWPLYVSARKSKWSAGHLQNHMTLTATGGEPKKRGKGLTVAGPMASLMPLPLADLTSERVAAWLEIEVAARPTNAAQSYRLLRAFIRWADDQPPYRGIVATDAYSASKVREAVPTSRAADGDGLQREQLQTWFAAVRRIGNPVISAYLQCLLLTGARREELAALRWVDVDFQWRSMTIKDKVEGSRTIPLTQYASGLMTALPRRNEYVFSSPSAESGYIEEPRIAHTKALAAAGLPHVSLQGLRRSFGTLCEWVEVPSGISAQIMGHKPSALAEKHYRRRPIDLLRKWHDMIEAWILEQAKIDFAPVVPGLRVVTIA